MFVIPGGGGSLPPINNSLRFNGSSSYLNRTFSGSSQKKTFSCWLKRGNVTAVQTIFGRYVSGDYVETFGFNGNGTLGHSVFYGGAWYGGGTTAAFFRDPSAFYHVVVAIDSTQGVTADRCKVYVNGIQYSLVNSGLPQNAFFVAFNYPTDIGASYQDSSHVNLFDGYLSRVCFVDGSALTPSSFGFTDQFGNWCSKSAPDCKTVVDAGGTNSFMLDWQDGTSTTTLGYDYSSKGNNWSLTGFTRSGTPNANECWMTDTPTNNYATLSANIWQQQYGSLANNTGGTLSNGGLNTYGQASYWNGFASSIQIDSGKWYWEVTDLSEPTADYQQHGIRKFDNSVGYAVASANFTINDVLGYSLDLTAGTLQWYKNGILQATLATGLSGSRWVPYCEMANGNTCAFNFGQRAFSYTPPAGFKTLCTQNLPAGSITTSGAFIGNANEDGPFIWLNGTPTAMTINGNTVTFATHVDKLANGFKVRTSSASYNQSGSNTYSVTSVGRRFKFNDAQGNP